MKPIIALCLYVCMLCIPGAASAEHFVNIRHYNTNNRVTAIEQDSLGFIWVGTSAGLYKFDGNIYRKAYGGEDRDLSVLNTFIRALYKDSDGNIWIGTDRRAVKYDLSADSFVPVDGEIENRRVNTFCQIGDSLIVAGTSNGIAVIDPVGCRSKILPDSYCPGIGTMSYISSDRDIDGNVWLISSSAFVRLAISESSFVVDKLPGTRQTNFIKADPFGRLWFNDGENIYIASVGFPENKADKGMQLQNVEKRAEGFSMVFRDGEAWLGTAYCGIRKYRFDDNGNIVGNDTFWIDESDKNGLPNFVSVTFFDTHGRLWLGTLTGLYVVSDNSRDPVFRNIGNRQGLAHNVVSDVCCDKDGNIWVSTSNGLNRITMQDGLCTSVRHYMNPSTENMAVTDNRLQNMVIDDGNVLWIGTKRGIVNFDIAGERFFSDPEVDMFIRSRNGYYPKSVYKDRAGNIYMGFVSGGIFVRNRDGRVYRIELPEKSYLRSAVNCIMQDYEGDLWFESQYAGLIRIPYESLKDNSTVGYELYPKGDRCTGASKEMDAVNTLFCCKNGTLLAGAANGLYRYLPEHNAFERIELNFLDDDCYVCSITEDDSGYCWVFTTSGVYRYGQDDKEFPAYMELGQGSFACNDYSNGSCVGPDGYIYSSGINGLTYFDPDRTGKTNSAVNICISDFTVLNRKIIPDTLHIPVNINMADIVNIYHSDTQFSFEFTTFDYGQTRRTQFCYKLENFDDDWISIAGGQNFISYSNLPPGHYVLRVKATDANGMWSTNERKIKIFVHTPWWETWWFRCLSLMSAAIIVFFIARQVYLQYRHRQTEKLNELKLDFYINVTHSLKTPLAMLRVPIEELLRDDVDMSARDRKELLLIMNNSVRKLSDMIKQLTEFRNLRQNTIPLNLVEMDIRRFVGKIFESLQYLFREKDIRLQYVSDSNSPCMITVDPEKIETVLFNLLYNAYTFTPFGGSVEIRTALSDNGRYFLISVKDTGIGISKENQKRIFERFWQGEYEADTVADKGIGLGLSLAKGLVRLHHGDIHVESSPGKGSVFTVELPVENQMHADAEPVEPVYARQLAEIESEFRQIDDATANRTDAEKIVLITLDNDLFRLMTYLLKDYDIRHLPNIGTSFHDVASSDASLVIVDVTSYSQEEGTGVCRHLKNDISTRHIPIILIANEQTGKVADYYNLGIDMLIEKTFDSLHLRSIVRQLLQNRQFVQEKDKLDLLANKVVDVKVESSNEKLMGSIMEVIDRNIANEKFSLSDFAEEMHMSRSVLHTKIQSITGSSPMDFLRDIRLRKAAKLLGANSYNVMQVSYMVGFTDSRYFSTCFKKKFGMTPREYMASHRPEPGK